MHTFKVSTEFCCVELSLTELVVIVWQISVQIQRTWNAKSESDESEF